MKMHSIAELLVNMDYKHETMLKQAKAYITDDNGDADITISLSDDFLLKKQAANPHLSLNDCEYIWTGSEFYNNIIHHNGILLHSCGVVMDGKAYLFSASSGVGKSTHASLWLKAFGDRAKILNDDKPAIRVFGDEVFAYGTPWSGKTDHNINIKAPLEAICFIERDTTNHIEKINAQTAIVSFLNQTIRPVQAENMDKVLSCLNTILKNVPVYKMYCNMDIEAATVAYNGMKRS